ncbi:uncharacterized protein LOC132304937 [Cornus florida]|uniref:uncharacterized protein LOC132304937 n=1 Tax=Cornus florida TaxID=4283 RepID=UPI00289FABBC|nr:uncharacterized protein LOC132304937 [Cornus florida]
MRLIRYVAVKVASTNNFYALPSQLEENGYKLHCSVVVYRCRRFDGQSHYEQKRRSPFRFENMWLRAEDFQGKVRSWWEGVSVTGSPSFMLTKKLRSLKFDLKKWNKDIFGNLEWRKNRALVEFSEIDRLEEAGGDVEELRSKKASRQAAFAEIASMEEILWRQKSRALWLKEGDRNTNFFHRLANAHRRSNHIGRIRVEGVELWREEELHNVIVSFYQKLYLKPLAWRPKLDGLHFKAISELDRDGLEIPFTEDEVL